MAAAVIVIPLSLSLKIKQFSLILFSTLKSFFKPSVTFCPTDPVPLDTDPPEIQIATTGT